MQKVLQVAPGDNVLIALSDLKNGERVAFAGETYLLVSSVPAKHGRLPMCLAGRTKNF